MVVIDNAAPDAIEYLDLLSDSLKIYIDRHRLERAEKDVGWKCADYANLVLLWLRIESGGAYSSIAPADLADFLDSVGVDLTRKSKSGRSSFSLDMKKVINPLIERGVQTDLLENYRLYRSYKSYSSSLSKLVSRPCDTLSLPSGRVLSVFDTHVEEQENLRTYYSDIAVVSIPKAYRSIITSKDDEHYLAWCDFPQADWRTAYNLFIRNEENIEIMRQCDDAYEGLARLAEGDKFDIQEFKNNRKDYKVACLKVFYNSRDKSEVSNLIRNVYKSSPAYQRYVFDLETLYHFKLPIPITSYFGNEQYLPEAPYPDAFISKGLNTPIQTFTSHLVNETVKGILNEFWKLGYSKEDINVYFVRHDEPIFQFRRNVLEDAWIFQQYSDIVIPGFSPIKLDFHFGQYYGEEDSVLTKEVWSSVNEENVTPLVSEEVAEMKAHSYYPVGKVENYYVRVSQEDDGTGVCKVTFLNLRTDEVMTVQTNVVDIRDAVAQAAMDSIISKTEGLSYLYLHGGALQDDLYNLGTCLVKTKHGYESGYERMVL